jgi:hypothetical protein
MFVVATGRSVMVKSRISPVASAVSISLVTLYCTFGQADGCSVGVCEATCKTEELPERAKRILAAHENLMVIDLDESLMLRD